MLTFHWFLPTNGGDGRHVVGGGHGVAAGASGRPASVAYLGQVARAAEDNGFEAALTPTGSWCEDAWLSTAMLSQVSERLKFLVAFRPGMVPPFLAAQMAATFQSMSGRRLLLNVVTGGESREQRMFGDFLDKDERYARCDEFLEVVSRLWAGETVDFEGDHLRVEGAALSQLPDPVPDIYFGGSSPAAGQVAARHADVYLTWGEPPAAVAEKVAWVRKIAAEQGRDPERPLRFGIRLHVVNRDTSEEAWGEARRLLDGIDLATIERVQAGLKESESEGQRRMLALVGSHEEVADLIEEYAEVGIDEFVLSAYPHLEGAYWFGEGVLPILAERGRWTHPSPFEAAVGSVPFGAAGGRSAAS